MINAPGPACDAAIRFIILGTQFGVADIAQAEQGTIGLRADDDVVELLRIDQTAGGIDWILELRSTRNRRLSQPNPRDSDDSAPR